MRTYLEHLSDAQLVERLAKIEALGKKTAARIAAGERSPAETVGVRHGRFVTVSALERSLNVQRSAWKQTREEMLRRQ